MQQLENDIKELIISSLALEDVTPADIDASAPLFVNGLGLDSIDALELGLALQKRYGVSLSLWVSVFKADKKATSPLVKK